MRSRISLLLLAAAPAAQLQLDPHPAGALVTLECDGPARWSQRFQGTRVLELLRSKQVADLWAPAQKWFDEQMAEAKKEAPVDVEAMRDGILAYAGRVRVAVLVEPEPKAAPGAEPPMAGYVAVGPDGHTDLGAACKEIERLALDNQGDCVPISLAGMDWLATPDDDVRATLPRMVGEHAVAVFFSADHEALVERLFTDKPGKTEADVPLRLQIDGGKAIDLIAASQPRNPEIFAKFMATLLGRIGQVSLTLSSAGEFVDLTFDVDLPGERGSMLAMLVPPQPALPALLDFVPRQHESFACGPVDFGQIEPMVKAILDLTPEAPIDWQGLEAAVEEHAGVRLGPDVLTHLGREYVLLGAAEAPDAVMDANEFTVTLGAIDGICVGLGLRDGPALARSLETILDRTGVLRMRKAEKYRDADVYRLTIPIVNEKLYWSVTDKMLVIAVGDRGRDNLHGLLDGSAAVARGDEPGTFPKEVTDRLALTEPKPSSLSFQRMTDTLDTFASVFTLLGGAGEAPFAFDEDENADAQPVAMPDFDPQIVVGMIGDLKKLLRTHRLEHALTVSHHGRDHLRQRTLW